MNVTTANDSGKVDEDDEDEGGEDDNERPSRGLKKTKSERQLERLAQRYARTHRVDFATAHARVLPSDRGRELYAQFIFERGV